MLLGLVITRGAGGPGDRGGPSGRSALPIVGGIRTGAGWGPAWVAAFIAATRALFEEWRPRCCDSVELLLDDCGDLVVSAPIGEDGFGVNHRLGLGIVHPEVWRLLAHPVDSTAIWREPQPVWVKVPEFGAVELDGVPSNHPFVVAGAIELGRRGAVSVRDWHGEEARQEAKACNYGFGGLMQAEKAGNEEPPANLD